MTTRQPDRAESTSALTADRRVQPDSFVVYPTRYADIPFEDRHDWCLTVVNGHLNGWSIRRGLGGTASNFAMNGDGTWEIESRHADNSSRRWSLDDALAIALLHVDLHKITGLSATDAIARADREHA